MTDLNKELSEITLKLDRHTKGKMYSVDEFLTWLKLVTREIELDKTVHPYEYYNETQMLYEWIEGIRCR